MTAATQSSVHMQASTASLAGVSMQPSVAEMVGLLSMVRTTSLTSTTSPSKPAALPNWASYVQPRLRTSLIADIGETAWAVYTILTLHADPSTARVYLRQDRIGGLIGKTKEAVSTAVSRLEVAGLLTKARRGRNNEYQLLDGSPLKNMTPTAFAATPGLVPVPFVQMELSAPAALSEDMHRIIPLLKRLG